MYVGTQAYDGDSALWTPFEYTEFWDFARTFCVEYQGRTLVFDAPFLELADEYSDYFLVYMSEGDAPGWRRDYRSWRVAHVVPVDSVVLDETRRRYILSASLAKLLERFEVA